MGWKSGMEKKKKIQNKLWRLIISIFLLLVIGTAVYLLNYYHASEAAMAELEHPTAGVVILQKDDQIIFEPEQAKAGMIFYPGGKVAFESYAPLMEACAESGILCVVPHMPGNLAVLDQNAADGIKEQYPQVASWYLAGHSLGGTIAAIYLGDHAEEYDGLILLASYSTTDLSKTNLNVLTVYGSEDGVMNREKYEACKFMLPPGFEERIIDGGCHAYFGDYGEQAGDGSPTITMQEQQRQTVQAIVNFIG